FHIERIKGEQPRPRRLGRIEHRQVAVMILIANQVRAMSICLEHMWHLTVWPPTCNHALPLLPFPESSAGPEAGGRDAFATGQPRRKHELKMNKIMHLFWEPFWSVAFPHHPVSKGTRLVAAEPK